MFSEGIRQDFMQPQVRGVRPATGTAPRPAQENPVADFGSVLQQQLQQPLGAALTFSGHALQRMQQRQLSLTQVERQALQEATVKARSKGAKETLILSDKAAFVVSVTNNMVITVMDKENLKDNLFTQIDSAIII
ncbi:MAG: flagellar protein [Symbiobacteriaceae bacterium]|nr:flagellar protein [Symbiobacteriaceae bacterium]